MSTHGFGGALASILFASCLLSACDGAEAQTEARKVADALTGGSAADSPQCQLYTVAEVAKYMGEPVTAGANAAGGTGCMWRARTKAGGNMLVQVVPARYHPASGGQRHPALADIGTQGFVREELGGWIAGAIVGDESIVVSVTSSRARESTAIELLKETLKRRTK